MVDGVEMKILITDPAQDIKKVLRFAPPLPANPVELTAWLLRQFDPSGAVSERTHELVLLSGEELREAGVLTHSSQIQNGLRLRVRLRSQTVTPPQPPQQVVHQQYNDGLAAKAPRLESQQQQQSNNQTAPIPQFTMPHYNTAPQQQPPPQFIQRQQQQFAPSYPHPSSYVPPHPMLAFTPQHGVVVPTEQQFQQLVSQVFHQHQQQQQGVPHVTPTATETVPFAQQHPVPAVPPKPAPVVLKEPPPPPPPKQEHRREKQESKRNDKSGSKALTPDDAVNTPQNLSKITERAKNAFLFLAFPKKKHKGKFNTLSKGVQRLLLQELLLCLLGTVVGAPARSILTEFVVVAYLRKRMKKLIDEGKLRGALKPEWLLYEGWVRGVITIDPKCKIPHQQPATNQNQAKKKAKRKKLQKQTIKKRNARLVIAPAYVKEAEALLCPLTEEVKLVAVLESLSSASWLQALPPGTEENCCGIVDHVTPPVISVPNKYLHQKFADLGNVSEMSVAQVLKRGGNKRETYTLSSDVTGWMLEAVRALLHTMAMRYSSSGCVFQGLASCMLANFKLPSQYATLDVWKAVIKWTTSRGLLNIRGTKCLLSTWSQRDKGHLTQHTTTIDLRLAEQLSLRLTRWVLLLLQDCQETLLRSAEETEGIPFNFLAKQRCPCFVELAREDQAATLCWCLFRLVKLGLIELRCNEAVVTLPPTAVKLDEAATTIHATDVLRNSVVCRTSLPKLFQNQQPLICALVVYDLVPSLKTPPAQNEGKYREMRRKLMSASGVLAAVLAVFFESEGTNEDKKKMMSLDMLTNEARWALTLHGQRDVNLAVSQQEVGTVVRYAQESGLVTWDVSLSGFVVTPGLFDTMYYLFLLRLKSSVEAAIAAKPVATTKKQKKKEKNGQSYFFPMTLKKMNDCQSHQSTEGEPKLNIAIQFTQLTFLGFLELAKRDKVVHFTTNSDGQMKSFQVLFTEEKFVSFTSELRTARPSIEAVLDKLTTSISDENENGPQAFMYVPAGLKPARPAVKLNGLSQLPPSSSTTTAKKKSATNLETVRSHGGVGGDSDDSSGDSDGAEDVDRSRSNSAMSSSSEDSDDDEDDGVHSDDGGSPRAVSEEGSDGEDDIMEFQ